MASKTQTALEAEDLNGWVVSNYTAKLNCSWHCAGAGRKQQDLQTAEESHRCLHLLHELLPTSWCSHWQLSHCGSCDQTVIISLCVRRWDAVTGILGCILHASMFITLRNCIILLNGFTSECHIILLMA